MPDRTNPANWPNARGPWPEVTDLDRLYDHGRPWCAFASGHPDRDGDGYPDATIHPAEECRTAALYLDDSALDHNGTSFGLEVFAAERFSFGELRGGAKPALTHIVVEFFDADGLQTQKRCSLTVGDGLRLARWLGQLADLVTTGGCL